MSEANGTGTAATTETVSRAEFDAAVERGRRFEGQLTDKEKTLAEYVKYGDPKTISAMKADYDNLRKTSANTPEAVDALIADKTKEVETRFGKKFTEFETTIQSQAQKIQKFEVVVPTMTKAASLFRDTELELVNMLVERDLASLDGEIVVKSADGKPLPSPKDPRKNMSVDEYLEALSVKYPGIAKPKTVGTGKEAGSTSGTEGTSGDAPPADFTNWPQSQQRAWFQANPKALDRFLDNGGKF